MENWVWGWHITEGALETPRVSFSSRLYSKPSHFQSLQTPHWRYSHAHFLHCKPQQLHRVKLGAPFPAGAETVAVQKFSPSWFEALPSAAHPIQPEAALWRVLKPLRAESFSRRQWSKFPSAKRACNSSDQKSGVFQGGRALLRISQLSKRCLCMKERQSSLRSSQFEQPCTALL